MICKIIDLQNVLNLQNRTSTTLAGNVSSRGARGQHSHRSKRLKENTWRGYIKRICGNTRCCAMFTKFNLEKKIQIKQLSNSQPSMTISLFVIQNEPSW